jgi:hypothetical protein
MPIRFDMQPPIAHSSCTFPLLIMWPHGARSSPKCAQLLHPALAFLCRLSSWKLHQSDEGTSWPDETCAAVLDATVVCWRQAVLQPLRASPIDWFRFRELIPAIPAEVRPTLEPELNQLTHPSARLCSCTPTGIAQLKQKVCATPYTCKEVQRRVHQYLVHHPTTEIADPLVHLVQLIHPLLPLPLLVRHFGSSANASCTRMAEDRKRCLSARGDEPSRRIREDESTPQRPRTRVSLASTSEEPDVQDAVADGLQQGMLDEVQVVIEADAQLLAVQIQPGGHAL